MSSICRTVVQLGWNGCISLFWVPLLAWQPPTDMQQTITLQRTRELVRRQLATLSDKHLSSDEANKLGAIHVDLAQSVHRELAIWQSGYGFRYRCSGSIAAVLWLFLGW